MKKKLGLDYHGVIDTKPDFFEPICKALIEAGHEIHIITGNKETQEIKEALNFEHGLFKKYTHFFSIVDYHESQDTKVWYDEKGTPWMDGEIWDKTKCEYCEREQIDLYIDDSLRYLEHFSTPYKIFKNDEETLNKIKQEISKIFEVEL
jgi:hypothetical protein